MLNSVSIVSTLSRKHFKDEALNIHALSRLPFPGESFTLRQRTRMMRVLINSKRQLWTYSGLALETRNSGEYRIVRGQLRRSKKVVAIRGLNKNHNHDLKNIFKGAAIRAAAVAGPFQNFYAALIDKGMKPPMARLTLCLSKISKCLSAWELVFLHNSRRCSFFSRHSSHLWPRSSGRVLPSGSRTWLYAIKSAFSTGLQESAQN